MTKSRNYNKKIRKNAKLKTQPQEFDDEPKPKIHLTAFKLNVANPTDWYELFNIQYYEHLQNIYNVIWKDVYNKRGDIQLETQIKVTNLIVKDINTTKKQKETSENQKGKGENSMSPTHTDESLFDKIIPSKKQTLYSLTLYHTTYTILIQGNRKSIWVTKEFP